MGTPAGNLSPADEKLQLEIAKLRQEIAKLQHETTALVNAAALVATDDAAVGQSKGQLELNKLQSDLVKVKAEAAIAGRTPGVEWAKAVGGFVTALAAIGALGLALSTRRADDNNRFRTDAAQLVSSLGDPSEAKRTAAAIALRPYAGAPEIQALAVDALAHALGAETSLDIQRVIAASLIGVGKPALNPLRDVVSVQNAIVSTDFYEVGDECFDIRALKPGPAQALRRLQARQSAVILAAEAISEIKAQQGVKAAVDLSGANLKCYPFHGLPGGFDGVNLTEAILPQASLYGKSFKGANLTHVVASDAEFTYADLTGATMTNADLKGAVMQCTKLLDAKGLTKAQLESLRSLEGARLDKDLAAAFQEAVKLKPGSEPCD